MGSNYVFKQAHNMIMKNTSGNYPAPFKILDVLKAGVKHGWCSPQALDAEVRVRQLGNWGKMMSSQTKHAKINHLPPAHIHRALASWQ